MVVSAHSPHSGHTGTEPAGPKEEAMTTRTKLFGLATVATVLVGSSVGIANAQTTTGTFTIAGGALTVSVPASAALSNAGTGAVSVTGALGTVTVTDNRGSTAGWVASTSSSSFTGTGLSNIANSAVTYAPGLVTAFSGVVTPVPGLGGAMGAPQTAFSGTVAVGNNAVSWNPTVTVALPSSVLAGTYTGTVTHSVA